MSKTKPKRRPVSRKKSRRAKLTLPTCSAIPDVADTIKPKALQEAEIMTLLKRRRLTTEQLSAKLNFPEDTVLKGIRKLQDGGALLYLFGDEWSLEREPAPAEVRHVYKSRPDGTYKFGFSSDQHLCSKYSRLDVLEGLYDHFAAAGVDRVFNSGNWIDGEARFNKHDLLVHGMDNQCEYMADHYPERDGIVTYAVAGDDHEGWYGQREGVDIGKHAEDIMRRNGRKDWVDLGYMEAFIELEHAKTGATAELLNMHPGGGSAYAFSYKPQKIVEGLQGGEKPAVLLIGHYHKMIYCVVRNVHTVQTGAAQDQTPFMRKKGIDAHVGGGIIELAQDSATGAITSCKVEFFQYFNEGYYNNRWSHGGAVNLPLRK